MKADLAIYCKQTVLPEGIKEVTVLITEGKIVDIVEGKAPAGTAKKSVSCGESVLMPGLIDSHVHINEPGRTEWEGFETATKAAAAGGVTMLVDMPLNSTPVTTTVSNFKEKLKAAEGKIFVNCGFWGGIVPDNAADIEGLIDAGVLGFKAFMTHSGIDDFPNASIKDIETIADTLVKHNLPLLVHAELEEKHKGMEEHAKEPYSYQHFLRSRPKEWEDNAIAALIKVSDKYKLRTHIVHLSSANSISQLKAAKAKGLPITVETCPHYLFFNAENIVDADPRFKCAPPIREKENNDQLWNALVEGTIDFVVTDHSPAPPEVKSLSDGNLKEAWGGISTLQFELPIIWSMAMERNVSLKTISNWMSTKIADFLNLPNKGRIQIGADADLVIWNPVKKMKVSPALIRSRHAISPYEGVMLSGLVEKTYVAGVLVYDKGSFVSSPTGNIILRNS
ncbi:MAG TPA: allantoinase AllB [Bacteroidia bacterium]|nr:allantoinase AllB [Bacteroidia bacterium]